MKGLKQGTKVLVFVIRPEWSKKREDVSIPSGMSLPKSWWGEAPDLPSDLPETIDTCNPSMRAKLRNAPSRRPSVCHLLTYNAPKGGNRFTRSRCIVLVPTPP